MKSSSLLLFCRSDIRLTQLSYKDSVKDCLPAVPLLQSTKCPSLNENALACFKGGELGSTLHCKPGPTTKALCFPMLTLPTTVIVPTLIWALTSCSEYMTHKKELGKERSIRNENWRIVITGIAPQGRRWDQLTPGRFENEGFSVSISSGIVVGTVLLQFCYSGKALCWIKRNEMCSISNCYIFHHVLQSSFSNAVVEDLRAGHAPSFCQLHRKQRRH